MENGPNKSATKRIVVDALVEKNPNGKGYRINTDAPQVKEVHQRLVMKVAEDFEVGMPELVYIGTHFNGKQDLYEQVFFILYSR